MKTIHSDLVEIIGILSESGYEDSDVTDEEVVQATRRLARIIDLMVESSLEHRKAKNEEIPL